MGSDLKEAEARLEGLALERADIQNRLGQAVEDADADLIIRLERRASNIDVDLFAARACMLKLRRADTERLRREAIALRDALEAELVKATKQYADVISVADEKRVAMQTVQVKIFSSESRAEQLRQDIHELNNELKTLVNGRLANRYKA